HIRLGDGGRRLSHGGRRPRCGATRARLLPLRHAKRRPLPPGHRFGLSASGKAAQRLMKHGKMQKTLSEQTLSTLSVGDRDYRYFSIAALARLGHGDME